MEFFVTCIPTHNRLLSGFFLGGINSKMPISSGSQWLTIRRSEAFLSSMNSSNMRSLPAKNIIRLIDDIFAKEDVRQHSAIMIVGFIWLVGCPRDTQSIHCMRYSSSLGPRHHHWCHSVGTVRATHSKDSCSDLKYSFLYREHISLAIECFHEASRN